MDKKNRLGERIRQLRETRRKTDSAFSGRQFSILVGIHPTYLSKIEHGEMEASTILLKKIAELLETNHDDLLALCGRIDPELEEIICKRPLEIPPILRAIGKMNPDQLEKLKKYIETLQNEEEQKKGRNEQ